MQHRLFFLTLGIAAISGYTPLAQGQTRPTLAGLTRRAEVIKPSAEELKWQRIPWLTDLAAGQRFADAERRPIFLWVTGDDPLERC